jgi:hypothetical protein
MSTHAIDDVTRAHFHAHGFVILRQCFDAHALTVEVEHALAHGVLRTFSAQVGGTTLRPQFAPLMTAHTPHSLALLDRLLPVASTLLGGAVLPTRAKAVRYSGDTPWHVDSTRALRSIGMLAYLEALDAHTGALCVRPHGSMSDDDSADVVLATAPGDVIVFDEHLLHGSRGGGVRRQWRVDFVHDSGRDDDELRAYFADIFPPDSDGGYDVDGYPSYGPAWRTSGRAYLPRMEALGVHALADAQESRMRTFPR